MTTQQWRQAENLFNEALDLPAADRAAWVRISCPTDSYVVDAVLRMLEADSHPGDEIRQAVRSAVKRWMAK